MILFTTGYQGENVLNFIHKISDKNIGVIIDIRENPFSRKPGFSKAPLSEKLENMTSLLRDHIYKEDNILYPCAQDTLTKEELASLTSQCEKIKIKK